MAKRFKPKRSELISRIPVIFEDKPFNIPVTPSKASYTPHDFLTRVG